MLPFTRTPRLDAAPMPPKKVSGIEITNAHGQDTTRKTNPLRIHSVQPPPRMIGGRIARKAAKITTTGV